MPVEIPLVPSVPNYRRTTTIEDSTYIFDVRWNARESAWYFDLLEEDETPIRIGLKIVLGTFIGRTCHHPLFQAGAFIALDSSGENRDPGLDDLGFGARVALTYWTVEDLYLEAFGTKVAPL